MKGRLFGGDLLEPIELYPLSHPWAYAHVLQGKRNTWFPEEVPLSEDVEVYKALPEEERHAVDVMLGFFNPMESLVAHNLVLSVYPHATAPEARLYLARQIWEEANHTMAFEYVLKTLPVDREKVFGLHKDEPAVQAKEAFLQGLTRELLGISPSGSVLPRPDLSTKEGQVRLLRNLVGYYIVLEGIFFYAGFLLALAFRRQNKLKGLASIVDWVIKDESLHLSFGIHLILGFLEEFPDVVTEEVGQDLRGLILKAVELERAYTRVVFEKPILGLSQETVMGYVEYIADRRLEELGLPQAFFRENPAKWLAVELDLPEQVNFFEAVNTSYEVGGNR
ncbi:MAG: ribonucleotide-diphosphate reductase subunit beta [Thermaceae bacterium]